MDVQKVTKTFVVFQYPGCIVAEEGTPVEVTSRSIESLDIPEYACGFRFFDRDEATVDGKVYVSEVENQSGWFYLGEEFTVEQVEAMNDHGQFDTLLANMRGNGWPTVIKTRAGNWFNKNEGDQVVNPCQLSTV